MLLLFYNNVFQAPLFQKASTWNFDFTSLVLASNLGLAYIAHYNSPNFYRSLKDTNSKRFRLMVNVAFITLVSLYTATMMAGYATFGDVCQGNILLNYHPNDILSTFGRLATGYVSEALIISCMVWSPITFYFQTCVFYFTLYFQ
jgi:amino acid permease